MQPEPILEIIDLSLSFTRYGKGALGQGELRVLRGLCVSVGAGEIVAVVGASGSGKSLLAHTVMGILPENCTAVGDIRYGGQPLTAARIQKLRGREILLVPQSVTWLDPLERVGPQVRREKKDAQSLARQRELFGYYGLPLGTEKLYPFELSGGMARRVLLSTAMMESPRLIIADEPTPGLDLEAAKKAMGHFRDFADGGGGVLLITHDIELALEVADRIAVFYAGATVEEAPVADFTSADTLRHPYTRALWRALPQHGFAPIPGHQPYTGEMPKGCPFGPRCGQRTPDCDGDEIPLREVRGGAVRCIHAE